MRQLNPVAGVEGVHRPLRGVLAAGDLRQYEQVVSTICPKALSRGIAALMWDRQTRTPTAGLVEAGGRGDTLHLPGEPASTIGFHESAGTGSLRC
jgi:hypothetical protein